MKTCRGVIQLFLIWVGTISLACLVLLSGYLPEILPLWLIDVKPGGDRQLSDEVLVCLFLFGGLIIVTTFGLVNLVYELKIWKDNQ